MVAKKVDVKKAAAVTKALAAPDVKTKDTKVLVKELLAQKMTADAIAKKLSIPYKAVMDIKWEGKNRPGQRKEAAPIKPDPVNGKSGRLETARAVVRNLMELGLSKDEVVAHLFK